MYIFIYLSSGIVKLKWKIKKIMDNREEWMIKVTVERRKRKKKIGRKEWNKNNKSFA